MTLDLYRQPADFEADIRILNQAEGGRKTPPFNHIRWDFCYADDDPSDGIHMIWPLFVDANGDAIAQDIPLKGKQRARMYIVDRSRVSYHADRLSAGTHFNCHEGKRVVAVGIVTRISIDRDGGQATGPRS